MGKILYFINGQPTEEDKQKASSVGAVFRDVQAWHSGDFIEQCDEVRGNEDNIPAPYRHLLQNEPEILTKTKKGKSKYADVSEKDSDQAIHDQQQTTDS